MQVPAPRPGSDSNVVPMPQPQVPQVFLAMAAAQMHAEGRLYAPPKPGTAEDLRARSKQMEDDQLIGDTMNQLRGGERVRPTVEAKS